MYGKQISSCPVYGNFCQSGGGGISPQSAYALEPTEACDAALAKQKAGLSSNFYAQIVSLNNTIASRDATIAALQKENATLQAKINTLVPVGSLVVTNTLFDTLQRYKAACTGITACINQFNTTGGTAGGRSRSGV